MHLLGQGVLDKDSMPLDGTHGSCSCAQLHQLSCRGTRMHACMLC